MRISQINYKTFTPTTLQSQCMTIALVIIGYLAYKVYRLGQTCEALQHEIAHLQNAPKPTHQPSSAHAESFKLLQQETEKNIETIKRLEDIEHKERNKDIYERLDKVEKMFAGFIQKVQQSANSIRLPHPKTKKGLPTKELGRLFQQYVKHTKGMLSSFSSCYLPHDPIHLKPDAKLAFNQLKHISDAMYDQIGNATEVLVLLFHCAPQDGRQLGLIQYLMQYLVSANQMYMTLKKTMNAQVNPLMQSLSHNDTKKLLSHFLYFQRHANAHIKNFPPKKSSTCDNLK